MLTYRGPGDGARRFAKAVVFSLAGDLLGSRTCDRLTVNRDDCCCFWKAATRSRRSRAVVLPMRRCFGQTTLVDQAKRLVFPKRRRSISQNSGVFPERRASIAQNTPLCAIDERRWGKTARESTITGEHGRKAALYSLIDEASDSASCAATPLR